MRLYKDNERRLMVMALSGAWEVGIELTMDENRVLDV